MRTDEGLLGFGVQLSTAGTKMLVSNLGPEVTDEDLEELFQEHGGPIKKAEIFYKQDGTSSGQGEVIFKRRADADKVPICLPCLRPSANGQSAHTCTSWRTCAHARVSLSPALNLARSLCICYVCVCACVWMYMSYYSHAHAQVLESPALLFRVVSPVLILSQEKMRLFIHPVTLFLLGWVTNSLTFLCAYK